MLNPVNAEFWTNERRLIWQSFNDIIMDTMLAGMSNGLPLLPAAIQPLVSWDVVNQAALGFLREYRSDILNQIDIVTERQTREIINDWLLSGDPLDSLETQLAPIFGATRADAIAATEVTRLYAQGNMMLWQSTGVVGGKAWQTARDERVCPFCGPLHNQIVELDQDFTLSADTIAGSEQMQQLLGNRYTPELAMQRAMTLLGNVGSTASAPPYHVRCRCWLKPVVALDLVEQQIGASLAAELFGTAISRNLCMVM